MNDFVLRGGTVVRPAQLPENLDILVRDGRIAGPEFPPPELSGFVEIKRNLRR